MHLYEITQEYADAFGRFKVDEDTGEILNLEEIEKVSGEFAEKVENVALYIKNIEALAGDIKREEESMARRRKRLEKKAESLKQYLLWCMICAKQESMETAKASVSFLSSEQVKITDEKVLPPCYLVSKVKISLDKQKIKQLIKSGEEIPGAEIVTVKNIQIK